MSALQPRTWAEQDRVAQVDRSATPWRWRLGTVTGLDGPHWLIVRWNDDNPMDSYVSCHGADDANLIRADDVPVDERWWEPQKNRDLLVRQEAARQFRAVVDVLPRHWNYTSEALTDLADDLASLDEQRSPHFAAIARALLTPAPAPAPTP